MTNILKITVSHTRIKEIFVRKYISYVYNNAILIGIRIFF